MECQEGTENSQTPPPAPSPKASAAVVPAVVAGRKKLEDKAVGTVAG